MQSDLFSNAPVEVRPQQIADGAWWLHAFALAQASQLLAEILAISAQAPFRHMPTKRGYRVAAAMTNCGAVGWVSDETGYRYSPVDPMTQLPWSALPPAMQQLARDAAQAAGYPNFCPDIALINRYHAGVGMGMHRDDSERSFHAPIVSISLGLPAVFLWGGFNRQAAYEKLNLLHGDVLVWGGADRLRYHAVRPIKPGTHPLTGDVRYNITFRVAQ